MRRDRRVRIVGGHAGAGKSEFCANLSVRLRNSGRPVSLVDLDVVNPYFTTRGIRGVLEGRGVRVLGPSLTHTSNDVPAVPAEVRSIFHDRSGEVVIDLGGDAAGSKILGSFRRELEQTGYDFLYLVNANRPRTRELGGALEFYRQCEEATGLSVSGLVNSTHLLHETSLEDLRKGEEICVELAERTRVPYRYLVAFERLAADASLQTAAEELFPIRLYLRQEWLD